MARERRNWTSGEDGLLKKAVAQGSQSGPVNWHNVAALIPGRTNKDCRKRWHYTVAAGVTKGTWTAEEDKQLHLAVEKHGTKWSQVALEMETRNGDQCSKRWKDTIDPTIDHSAWTLEKDQLLLQSVEKFGRNWKTIVDNNFTGRTAISAKNRYSVLTRKMRDQGSRQASKRPSNSICSPNSSSRNNRATISQKSASSEQLDSDDDMNDLDADASTDDDTTQFAESSQAADDVFSEASIYPKTSSGLNVSKKSHNLPSPQRPTYSMPSSHDTSENAVLENEFQYNAINSLGLPDSTATSFFLSESTTSIQSTSAAPTHASFPFLDTVNEPIPSSYGSPRPTETSSYMDLVTHETKVSMSSEFGAFSNPFSFPMYGNNSPGDTTACALSPPSTFSATTSGTMLDSLTARSKDEKHRFMITVYCAPEQAGSLFQSIMEVIHPIVAAADGSVHISM